MLEDTQWALHVHAHGRGGMRVIQCESLAQIWVWRTCSLSEVEVPTSIVLNIECTADESHCNQLSLLSSSLCCFISSTESSVSADLREEELVTGCDCEVLPECRPLTKSFPVQP